MEKDTINKLEFNVHDGGQVIIANDNAKVSANVNNECKRVQDEVKDCTTKTKLIYQEWFKCITVILIIAVVFICIYQKFFGRLVYEEGRLTPIYYPILLNNMDARDYSNQYLEKSWDLGCILSVYISNKKMSQIMVSETSVIIDDLKKKVKPKVYVIGYYSKLYNTLSLYVINNGMGYLENGDICIRAQYYDESNSFRELTKDQILSLIGTNNIIELSNLTGGEIRKVVDYELNESIIKDLRGIWVRCEIIEKKDDHIVEINNQNIGIIGYYDGEIGISYGEGDNSNEVVERSLIIDVDADKGKEMKLPANFTIGQKSEKCILYTLYFTSSCEVTFHAKVRCAGEKDEIETEKFTQEIYVPLYKEEDEFLPSVRKFIEKYEIDTYYYNSNPIIQKEINYDPMENIEGWNE